ncbi:MAG: beta-propeller fold lactonase family protein [Mucilaginibacter sp.]
MTNKILLILLAFSFVAHASGADGLLVKPAPVITSGPATGIISACIGSVSISPNIQQFAVSGNALTTNITVTAPANFQVSLAAGSGYGSSVSLTESGGIVSSIVVYVRSAASAAIGNISGNVVLSSTGATSQNVAVTGRVHALPTINTVANQTVINGAATPAINFSGTASFYTWTTNTPGIGLPASGIDNIAPFTAVNTGATAITATITVTPNYRTSLYAYVADAYNGNVLVINTVTNAVVATIPVGLSPFGVAVTPDATKVFVTNFEGNTVSVINTATNSVSATITVPAQPRGIAMSPDGSRVYVISGVTSSMAVINTATNTVISTIAVGSNPNGAIVSADGSRVYVTSLLSGISVFDTATLTLAGTIYAGSTPFSMVVNPNGSWLYIANANSNSVSVINTTTNAVAATIPVGTNPFASSISPDGNRLYVTNQNSNNVSVINTTTNAVIATIPVGSSPRGISVSPDGSQLYVTNINSFNISVISTATNTVTATLSINGDPLAFGNFVTGGPGCSGPPITFTITVNPSLAGATITAGAATGSISSCAGTPSASPNIDQFTVSGSKLTANITATAPAGFEVSLASGSGYTSSVIIAQSGGSVSNTTVYVRSSTAAPTGHISGSVVLTSAGTTSQNVLVSGVVKPIPSVNAVQNQTVAKGAGTTAVNFTGNASTFNWVNNTPAIGLAASGTGNIPSFIAVNPGATPLTATITLTPATIVGLAYITNRTANTVSVINTNTNTVVSTIPVGKFPQGVSVSPDGSKVYVTNGTDGTVSVINTATNTVTATVPVGTNPSGIAVSPDGSTVYVSNSIPSGSVSVINAATNTVTATITVGSINSGITVSPDGSKVYLACSSNSNVVVIDAATNTITTTISGGVDPQATAITPDGKTLYETNILAGNVSVINTATNTVTTTIPVGTSPFGISMSPDGSKVYVGNLGSANLSVINTSTNTVTGTITVGNTPDGISVSPDGAKVYVANQGDNTVSVINTTTNTVLTTVSVGAGPSAFGNFVIGGSTCTATPGSFTITVSSGTPTIIATGTLTALTTIQGTASASTNFNVSGTNMTAGILVSPPPGFEVSLDNITFSSTVTVGASGSIASTPVYARLSASAGTGTYSGNLVLSSPAAANVNEATVASTITSSSLQNQTITFAPIGAKTFGAADFDPGATASSGLAVNYTSSNTAVATIVAGKIHIVGAGTSNITGSQTGNASFNAAADIIQLLTVNKAAQTITFVAPSPVTYGTADITLTGTASSGLSVSYVSSNTAVATIVNGKIHVVGAGAANITASQAGDGNFSAAADVLHVLTINKAAQTITFPALTSVTFGAADINPTATASSGLGVTYSSNNPAVATVVNTHIHIVGVGTAVITASQAGDANFTAATNVTSLLTVNIASQTITFAPFGTKNISNPDFDPGATVSSGLAVIYTSSNTAVATIVSSKIHIVGTGTSTITASQSGNANFSAAASVQQLLTVIKDAQTITFANLPSKVIGDADFDPGASASSGLPVSYTSSNLAVATIVSGQVHIAGIGSADITASQDGDATFAAAADVTQTLTVADIVHFVSVAHAVVTPNGDAINAILKFDGIIDFPDNKVVLVNANGVKIYEQSGYDNGARAFDGHSNITGMLLQQGTYFYMVEYNENGTTRRIKGYFIIKY